MIEDRITSFVRQHDPQIHFGVVAQDVREALINHGIDPDKFALVNGTEESGTMTISPDEFTPLLIKAIQQQQTRIEQLEADVAQARAAFQNRMAQVEARLEVLESYH